MSTLLLADDDFEFRRWMREVLCVGGQFTLVGEASDGEQAVAMARALAPEVAVLDLHMPRLNGFQVAEAIRHQLPGAFIIITSGMTAAEAALFGRPPAGSAFIPKTAFTLKAVQEVLATVRSGR